MSRKHNKIHAGQQHQKQAHEHSQPKEMAQLQAIEAKVRMVESKLHERLPHQYAQLTALVCGYKWRLHNSQKEHDLDAIVKKLRMELGSYDYHAKEQAEFLTRYLCELDNVLSFGNAQVKEARKALVVYIQNLLNDADTMKVRSQKLKVFGERMIARMLIHNTPEETQEDVEMNSDEVQTAPVNDQIEELEEEKETVDQVDQMEEEEPADLNGIQDEEIAEEEDEDGNDEDASDVGEKDETMEEAQEEALSTSHPPKTDEPRQPLDIDVHSLPVWKPYYQIQKRADGIYMIANLRGIHQEHMHVECFPSDGVLRISGFKLPTQKDLLVTEFSGTPTFGRFAIVERFPAQYCNMDEATQLLQNDGTLEIRVPYYFVHHPRFLRAPQRQAASPFPSMMRSLFFEPQQCRVW